LDVLHGDERLAHVLAELEDGDDVGVLQPAGRSRLAQEPFAHLLAVAAFANQLDGDMPADLGVERAIQRAHAPLPDFFEKLVIADLVGDCATHVFPRARWAESCAAANVSRRGFVLGEANIVSGYWVIW